MLKEKKYTLNELIEAVSKGTEFKPKFGDGVEKDNKTNNKKAIDDINSETKVSSLKDITKKMTENSTNQIEDGNKTTLDNHFANEPGDDYKKRVEAQVKGYVSEENEETSSAKENDSLEYDGNEKFLKARKEKSKEENDKDELMKKSGLVGRVMPDGVLKNKTIYREGKLKRLHFKNTVFLSEAQMMHKVPEEYKVPGSRFLMKDATGTEYLIECNMNDAVNYVQLSVVGKINKEKLNEEMSRIHELYQYNSSDYYSVDRNVKGEKIDEMLGKSRQLFNNKKK